MPPRPSPIRYLAIGLVIAFVVVWTHNMGAAKKATQASTATNALPATQAALKTTRTNRGSEVTALLLNWRTPLTLANTLRSYVKYGLFDYMKETIIYFQEYTDAQGAKARANHPKIRTLGDSRNVNIHWGMEYLVENATTEFVLFLEKDWELIEPYESLVEQIDAAVAMIEAGVADVVRLRSRKHPGRDFYAKETFQGREDDVWHRQENLMCNFYHWIDDFAGRFPDKATVCWQDPLMYCVKARYCNWTNNPVVFRKSWWKKAMSKYARKTPDEMRVWGSFESELNSVVEAWNLSPWVVGLAQGLFTHHEIDG